jgi:hypothetical protein
MRVLRESSVLLERPPVRAAFIAVGAFATLALAPLSTFGAFMLASAPFSNAPDRYQSIGWWAIGFCGLLGLVGAWLRVLMPGRHFAALLWLRVLTALLLCIGLAGALLMGAWLPVWGAITFVCGVFLLAATLGARGLDA